MDMEAGMDMDMVMDITAITITATTLNTSTRLFLNTKDRVEHLPDQVNTPHLCRTS